MKIELSDELEISQQISNSSQIRSNSYIYNQMLKINNGNKLLTFQQIMVNQNNNSQNSQISELTFRSLSIDIDNKLMQEFQSNRHMIIPHQMPYSLQSPFSSINKQRCSICFTEIQDIIKIEECNHQFCQKCVTLYLYNKIICGEIQKISCPQDGCKTILNELVIKQNIDNEVYLKYQRFQLIKQYEHITNGKWCPRPDCFNFIYQQGNSKILQCKCGQQFCFDCGNVLHPDKSCEDNIDQVFAQAIKDHKIQKCPKCKANIIKNGGCNHMTCYKCSYNFCWLCGSKYNSIHYDWMNPFNCPGDQYSERDPYQFPKILICLRAIFKIFIYLLLSPLIAIGGIGMLLYGLGYILLKICKLCGICLPCICCCC